MKLYTTRAPMKLKLIAALLATSLSFQSIACTGISLASINNDQIQARTIEWGGDNLNSKLITSPRDFVFTSYLPNQTQGLSWKSKYGFVGMSVKVDRFIAEGLNEEGLSAGLFYFNHYGSLAKFDPEQTSNNITDMDFVRWILSQFKTVDEVKAAINEIKIVPVHIFEDGTPTPTAHWRVADKQGNNIVIEIMNEGKINIHENKAKVLTNSPDYNWHVTNLNNYINLHPGSSPSVKINDIDAFSFGVGSAFVGLPGDISPPSRFVRAAFYVNTAPKSKNADAAVSQAFHILNNFDLPIGSEFSDPNQIPDLPSATQWTAVSDLTNERFFYKTMNDSAIKYVDLKTIDFKNEKETAQAIDNGVFHFEKVTVTQ